MEPSDLDLEFTARREGKCATEVLRVILLPLTQNTHAAFEEIGLPMEPERVRYLTTLPPFLTRSHLIVTPVVVFILDPLIKVRPAFVYDTLSLLTTVLYSPI
jgi:hypothetical protein